MQPLIPIFAVLLGVAVVGEAAAEVTAAGEVTRTPRWITHRVARGETLGAIATRYAVSIDELVQWNAAQQLDRRSPVPGRILQVRTTRPPVNRPQPRPRANPRLATSAMRPRPAARPPQAVVTSRVEPIAREAVHRAISVGAPHEGTLQDGLPLPDSELYDIAYRPVTYGSGHTVQQVVRALAQFRQDTGYRGRVVIGAISKADGGRFEPHRSHQSGRDVDVHLPHRDGRSRPETPRDVDWIATWALIRAFVATGEVEVIFLDRELQVFLQHAGEATGASAQQVRAIMRRVTHAPGHRRHIHVRIRCGPHESSCR